ncbi:MAG TPA: SDR family oxidoreductase [Pirellulaceae bacterium]|jgi:hypothetical protein|nr:SDR family oxidoreductase [Pirellulaceae bacterium]
MNTNEPDARSSRRGFIASGAGLAASAVAGTALGQSSQASEGKEHSVRPNMQNPLEQYPQPPFEEQRQEWPGLSSKMKPVPDYGEKTYQGSGRLQGRKALITGGDSGIGRAAAIAFAREGADVAISYLPEEEPDAKDAVAQIEQAGRKAVALPGDIRDEKFCQKLVADAVKQLGGLDILVNNAAYQMAVESIDELTTEQFDRVFKTNVYAMFWITKAAIPHLPPGAAIVNTASIQAYDPSPMLVDYAQTKACIVSFTKSMAKQLAEKGIRVNAVAPGPFWTPLIPSTMPQEKVQHFGADNPLKRPGQPAELAPTYVLLASQEASYVTGEVFGNVGGDKPF